SRVDEDGVLVLSEFAGAADELADSLLVNPYDVDAIAAAMQRALMMDEPERRARMQALRAQVLSHDVHRWVASFLEALDAGG
ncbi:MAG TPA: trehalose-6-phosphate synthase, partial [Gemmatimonadaceae bacterium]|nr:trehalose-6-phosphate synthase [Gemmatimonadaceae bacterium]